MKTLSNKMTILVIAASAVMLSIFPMTQILAQSANDILEYADELSEYYYGPMESDGYMLTMYNEQVNFETIDQEELGTAILGGLILSYSEAGKKDNIGVIILNSADQAVALGMERKTFKKYLKGRITIDELLAQTTTVTLDLADVPDFNASLMEEY
jgi:hypothetical protein